MRAYNTVPRLLIARRLLRDARKEYREAQRTYRQFPCKATEDDLIVARDCYRFLRRGKHVRKRSPETQTV